ncbi:hypothetical protein VFPPC_16647 [Pochonia chlamydosporia 170]|uniref:Rhodopsin domain-containing protein n=1 Tax=Pochonia chlamydosporia 170 TaxID=1380566 RepID=A0A179FAP8_METCM|nr:hypothetical protein VFPPC_16647 [Pochonia chlamydosporia 170]OAQ62361.1 hypothetical protein VFPPC_16647 [Pochonia chlamydosporia 170]
MKAWAIGLFGAEITYTLSLVFIKSSILAFYWRVFDITSAIKPLIWILFGMVCAWGTIIAVICQCLPTSAFWERFDPDSPLPPSQYDCGVDMHKFFYWECYP